MIVTPDDDGEGTTVADGDRGRSGTQVRSVNLRRNPNPSGRIRPAARSAAEVEGPDLQADQPIRGTLGEGGHAPAAPMDGR